METHDKVMLGILIVLFIASIALIWAYFYVYSEYKQNTDDLKVCVDYYNNLSWQYYFGNNFSASYWYNNGTGRVYGGANYDTKELCLKFLKPLFKY